MGLFDRNNKEYAKIHISKENEKEFAQILDKILKGDK